MSRGPSPVTAAMAAALSMTAVIHARAADEPDSPGTRVRVIKKAGDQRVVGRLVARAPEQIAIQTGPDRPPVQIPYAQIAQLQVSEGRHRPKGAGLGALVGLVAAGAVYASTDSDCTGADCAERFAWMAAPSMAAGALLGFAVAPERWRNVDRVPDVTSLDRSRGLRIVLRPVPGGGVSATAAFGF